jgi:hypothetical protein
MSGTDYLHLQHFVVIQMGIVFVGFIGLILVVGIQIKSEIH